MYVRYKMSEVVLEGSMKEIWRELIRIEVYNHTLSTRVGCLCVVFCEGGRRLARFLHFEDDRIKSAFRVVSSREDMRISKGSMLCHRNCGHSTSRAESVYNRSLLVFVESKWYHTQRIPI